LSTSIVIPKTIEAAKAGLGGIEALLTAKQWERAAIVYAFTQPGAQGGTQVNDGKPPLTISAFVALGITGLRDRHQVRLYRKAWESAMEVGAPNAKPGDTIVLPDLPWKDHFGEPTADVQERVARSYITRNPQVAVEAIKAVPAVAEAVTTAIVNDNELANTVARKSFAKSIGAKDNGPSVPTTTIPTYDYEKRLSAAITVVNEAIADEQSGTWTPGPGEAAMLTILFLNLRDRADRYAAAQPAVHGEIDAFLRESNTAKED
jgi:hypothetical protein